VIDPITIEQKIERASDRVQCCSCAIPSHCAGKHLHETITLKRPSSFYYGGLAAPSTFLRFSSGVVTTMASPAAATGGAGEPTADEAGVLGEIAGC